jgi:hypothetical protein
VEPVLGYAREWGFHGENKRICTLKRCA